MNSFQKGADDWICPDTDCKNVNYARRTHCHRCKVERKDAKKATSFDKKKLGSEIGKNAAEKSRGLFSAEDWQCTQCANVNWSRRQTCNMCNAPKFNEVEERTGTGGGYNERQNVEYKEKEPSDDEEFDKWGRRKKKPSSSSSSGNQRKSPSPERKKPKPKSEEDDEEEEDDDEEGDLSKYNLWDSDDGEDKKDTAKAAKEPPSSSSTAKRKERSKSRSRSRSRSSSSRSRHGSSSRRKRRYSCLSSSSSSSDSSSSRSSTSSTRRRRRRR